MNEVKKNFSKWMYWFLLAVAIILVYKFLDNFTAIGNAIGKFVGIISPFLAGTLMAYLLYIPASRIEKKLLKSKKKFFKKRARGLSVFITFTLTILLIILCAIIIYGIYFGIQYIKHKKNMKGKEYDPLSAVALGIDPQKLKDIGRLNVLILGESGIPGEDYKLTDSIMVASYNPQTQQASLLTIPRDSYVGKKT